MKAFIESQFAYAPLLNLFHSRELNNKINVLQFVYHDYSSTFKKLLEHDNSVTIHHRNIQYLAIELFKVKSDSAPVFLNNIFSTRTIPNNSRISRLRSQTDFYNYHNPRTARFGTETLRSLGPRYGI